MARTKHVITMMEDIRRQAMRRISRRWCKANKVDSFLTPITLAILEKARVAKKYCKTIGSSANLYEVTEYDTIGYTVDLQAHQCACKRWDLTGIPCRNAICVFDDNDLDLKKYVSDFYEASALKNTYDQNIRPVNGEKIWIPTEKPPISISDIRKPRGRPKTRDRRKKPFEDLQNPNKVIRHGRVFRCSQCSQDGHIKTGCKNEPVAVEGPKNRRGIPRKVVTENQLPPTPKPTPKKKKPATKPAPSKTKPASKPNPKKRKANPTVGSQPLLTSHTNSTQLAIIEFLVSSSAPATSVSSNKPKPRKRARALKTATVENTSTRV